MVKLGKRKRSSSSSSSMGKLKRRMKRMGVGLRTGGFVVGRKGRIGTELKFVDTAISSSNFQNGTASFIQCVNGLALGTTASTRIGRQVALKSLTFRMEHSSGQTTTSTGKVPATCRILLVYDGQTNGANPLATDVLDSAVPESLLNLSNRDRFRVLREWKYQVASQDINTSAVPSSRIIKGFVKIPKAYQKTTYNAGNAGTSADITTGGLFMIFIWDSARSVWATAQGICSGNIRVRYSDM